jgi:hypothetical protein
VVQVLSI